MANFSDDELFEVESILQERKRKGVLQYLIRWKDSGSESWENAKSIIADSPQLVENFLKSKKKSKSKRSTSKSRSKSRSRSSSRTRVAERKSTRSRSRGRVTPADKEKKEESQQTKAAAAPTAEQETKRETVVSESSRSITKISVQPTESNQQNKIVENMTVEATQRRVLRSSTKNSSEELEVQRVHNEQRPVREDDTKPRSSVWKVADYAVIILFAVSVVAAIFLCAEKFVDLKEFRRQAFPNMSVLQARLANAWQSMADVAYYGVEQVTNTWLYLMDKVKGDASPVTVK